MQQMNLMGRIILINYICQNIRDGFIWNKKKEMWIFTFVVLPPQEKNIVNGIIFFQYIAWVIHLCPRVCCWKYWSWKYGFSRHGPAFAVRHVQDTRLTFTYSLHGSVCNKGNWVFWSLKYINQCIFSPWTFSVLIKV